MSLLSRPLSLPSGTVLPNRIAKSAMSERLGDRRFGPTDAHVRLYRRWARGGAGLLITGNVMVDSRHRAETGNVVIEDDQHVDALKAWAASVDGTRTQLWMQINHPGRQTPRFVDAAPVAPSAVPLDLAGAFAPPRALEEEEILDIIARFGAAARAAREAGFHGVQIHGAHGYLVSQFLSPVTNLRDDAWGGDEPRRRRFLLEIVAAMRSAVGPDFPISVKLNSADFQKGGFTEDASMGVVEALEAAGIDLIEVSGGTYEKAVMFEETVPRAESSRRREAFFADYSAKVRERTSVPVMVTGGFRTAAGMEEALGSGATDLVGMARPLAFDPDLPGRLLSGESDAATAVRLTTGWKLIDSVIQGGWYQAQIKRLGQGREPDPNLWRLRAVWEYVSTGPRRVPTLPCLGRRASRADLGEGTSAARAA